MADIILICNACKTKFEDDDDSNIHYTTKWHHYNLKRQAAGVPGVTEELFLAKQALVAKQKNKARETRRLHTCEMCEKGYKNTRALSKHFQTRGHVELARQAEQKAKRKKNGKAKPKSGAPTYNYNLSKPGDDPDYYLDIGFESGDDQFDTKTKKTDSFDGCSASNDEIDDEDEDFEIDLGPTCCFMCDRYYNNIEKCMLHLHKQHGLFIPDIEYLKDPEGLITYLANKVRRNFECLYCNVRRHTFDSLEAVRMHMEVKLHCKIHFGEFFDDDEEGELEDYFDYSSSYIDAQGNQLIVADMNNYVKFGPGGSELIITSTTEKGTMVKIFGAREFLRYYQQKPRPTANNRVPDRVLFAARYRSMVIETMQSKLQVMKKKVMKQTNKQVRAGYNQHMRTKNSVAPKLPKTYSH